MESAPVVIEVTRGSTLESCHRGTVAAVDSRGHLVAHLGDVGFVTFLRSSAKPFQAIPLITSGAAAHYNISDQELAVIIASHSGEQIHTETVAGLLARIGLTHEALKCGIHEPYDKETSLRLGPDGISPLHNNCSGKHAGMLATALFLGLDVSTYDDQANPIQQQILATVATFAGVDPREIALGIDGCGVPSFATSMRRMALSYARLVCPPQSGFDPAVIGASERVVTAMIEYPEMIGATRNRLDSDLMKVTKGKLIAKVGAEGVHAVGVRPGPRYPFGLGVAVKIEDGDERLVRGMVVTEALRQLGVLSDEDLSQLGPWREKTVQNLRGDLVGHIRPAFRLNIT